MRGGREVRVGLIGLGVHGARYRDHLARGEVPGMRLTAVCRREEEAGRRQADELGCRWAASAEELADDPEVDALVIASSPSHHLPALRAALAAGKPALVEKPVVLTPAEGRALLAALAAPDAPPVMAAHTLRFDAFMAGMARGAAELGPLEHVQVTLCRPGLMARLDRGEATPHRALFDIAVHQLDWASLVEPRGFERAQAFDRGGRGAEALCVLTGRGATLELLVRLDGPAALSTVRLFGREALLEGDQLAHTARRLDAGGERPLPLGLPLPTLIPTLRAFLGLVRGGPNPVPFAAGVRAVARADACLRSIASGRPEAIGEEDLDHE